MFIQRRMVSKARYKKLLKRGADVDSVLLLDDSVLHHYYMKREGPVLILSNYHGKVIIRGKLPFAVDPVCSHIQIAYPMPMAIDHALTETFNSRPVPVEVRTKECPIRQFHYPSKNIVRCDAILLDSEHDFKMLLAQEQIDAVKIDRRRGTIK